MVIIDRTTEAARFETNANGTNIISRFGGRRSVDHIDAVMLHQVTFARASGRASFDRVIAHYVLLLNGEILQVRPLDALLNDSWAGSSIHFEFEGNYPNEDGGIWCPRTQRDRRGRPLCESHLPSPDQIRAGRELIADLKRRLPNIRHVYAHRQASNMQRANCPGPHIWYNVARWATVESGLGLDSVVGRDLRHRVRQEQRPIPPAWLDARFAISL
jgi:hypothetical protein